MVRRGLSEPRDSGYLSQAEAHICVYQCDHADRLRGCYINGDVKPVLQRCTLECYLYARQQSRGPQVPRGYLTVNQIVERYGEKQETLIQRLRRGVYPGALKMRKRPDSKEWLWIVPEGEVREYARLST